MAFERFIMAIKQKPRGYQFSILISSRKVQDLSLKQIGTSFFFILQIITKLIFTFNKMLLS